MAQFARCPRGRVEPGGGDDAAEGTADVVVSSSVPLRVPNTSVVRCGHVRRGWRGARRERRRTRRGMAIRRRDRRVLVSPRLADRAQHRDRRRDRGSASRVTDEVDVSPAQRADFLGAGPGQQREHDVGVQGESSAAASRASAWARVSDLDGRPACPGDGAERDDVALDLVPGHGADDGAVEDRVHQPQGAGADLLGLGAEPAVDVLRGQVAQPPAAERGDDPGLGDGGVVRRGRGGAAGEAVGEPVTDGVLHGVGATGDGEPVGVVAQDLAELCLGGGLGGAAGLAGDPFGSVARRAPPASESYLRLRFSGQI